MKPTRETILELTVKKIVGKNAVEDYKLFLFSDMLITAKCIKKDRYKFKSRTYLDMLRVTDVVAQDSKL